MANREVNPVTRFQGSQRRAPSWEQLLSYLLGCVEKESSFAELLSRSSTCSKYFVGDSRITHVLAGMADDIDILTTDDPWRELAMTAQQRGEALFIGWPVIVFHKPSPSGALRRKLAPLVVAEIQLPPQGMPIPDALTLASDPTLHPRVLSEYGLKEENIAELLDDYPLELAQGSTDALTAYVRDLLAQVGIPMSEPLDAEALVLAREAEIDGPGACNSAIVFRTQAATYHAALLQELRTLRSSDPTGSAAAILVGSAPAPVSPAEPRVLAPVPLNEAQEKALEASLAEPLTVVTGPPGTGKSQLVLSVIASCWASGQSVLLASTNNQAVDVVVERARDLVDGLVIRTGNRERRGEAARQLTDLARPAGATATLESLEESVKESRNRVLAARQRIEERTRLETALSEMLLTFEHLVKRYEWDISPLKDFQDLSSISVRIKEIKTLAEERFSLEERKSTVAGILASIEPDLLDRESLSQLPYGILHHLHKRVVRLRKARLFAGRRWRRLARKWNLAASFERAAEVASALQLLSENSAISERLARLPSFSELRSSFSEFGLEPPPDSLAVSLAAEHLLKAIEVLSSARSHLEREAKFPSIGSMWRELLAAMKQHQEDAREYLKALVARASSEGAEDIRRYAMAKHDYRTETGPQKYFPNAVKYLRAWATTSLSAGRVIPLTKALFDLVIIDEASQCSLPSVLPLLYRAKRALIIGDPLQLSHISTLTPTSERAIAEEAGTTLSALVTHHLSYRTHSAYAACENRAGQPHLLDEHYRSHPDIIGLSNTLFYEGSLAVLTDPERLFYFGDPAVAWKNVKGRVIRPEGGSAFNAAEATAVVDALVELVEHAPEGATFGVVTPFSAQAQRIMHLAESRLPPRTRAAVRLQIGTAHRFQGDERDVIIFSPVLSEGIAESSRKWLLGTPNLFNVAVTRARSYLLIVGDLEASLKSEGFLAELARYVHGLQVEDRVMKAAFDGDLHSEAEERLYRALVSAGVEVEPRARVLGYECDFVVAAGEAVLNIECDGSQHYEGAGRLRRQDLARDRLLKMQGYTVLRVPAWRCLLSPDDVVDEILTTLQAASE